MTRCSYARNTFIPKILKHVSRVVKIKKTCVLYRESCSVRFRFRGQHITIFEKLFGELATDFLQYFFTYIPLFPSTVHSEKLTKKSQDLVRYLCSTCRKELTIQRNQNPELLALWCKIIFHCHNRPCIRTSETFLEEH